MLKITLIFSLLFSASMAFSQDPSTTLKLVDSKIYSLKNKGIKDFSVDISSSKLTQQINSIGTFGQVKELYFRVYWTLAPEKVDIEVFGLPEGFKEVKEELKLSVVNLLDNILPLPLEKRFAGYAFSASGPGSIAAKDTTGIAEIPNLTIKIDQQLRITEIQGIKPVGSVIITPVYEKDSFSDGRWVLKKQITKTSENGQEINSVRTLAYAPFDGISAVRSVSVETEQRFVGRADSKPVSFSETIEFKNYKINNGAAAKHFLKDVSVP